MTYPLQQIEERRTSCFNQLLKVHGAVGEGLKLSIALPDEELRRAHAAMQAAEMSAIREALLCIIETQGVILHLLTEDDSEPS